MRHRKSGRKLKRTASHRRATLAALATALLRHKRITTTVAKAKETRMVVERMITRARRATALPLKDARGVHERRQVGRMIRDREVISELFSTIATKVGARPGGYTRIVKLGQRKGDAAEMAVIELVDFNTGQEEEKPAPKEKKSATPRKPGKPKEKPSSASKPKGTGAGSKKKDLPTETQGS
ncbi:MAG: ribosomal protein [Bacteroidetes bacterium]|nr:ribosomal protein [Bacteroidota bacterium]